MKIRGLLINLKEERGKQPKILYSNKNLHYYLIYEFKMYDYFFFNSRFKFFFIPQTLCRRCVP